MLRGLNPWWHWLLERENPRKRCHYNSGGYMTLAELGMAFWHDLAAPVIAGILASMIVNWLNKRK